MVFKDKGENSALIAIVKTIIVKPKSPPGIIPWRKTMALNRGRYKISLNIAIMLIYYGLSTPPEDNGEHLKMRHTDFNAPLTAPCLFTASTA